MPRKIEMVGRRFGRLLVVAQDEHKGAEVAWLCQCECGGSLAVRGAALRSGNTKSCGCIHREQIVKRNKEHPTAAHTIHGMSGTRTFRIWCEMRKRCTNPNSQMFRHYGGRGIKVCSRWSKFENFLADMGEVPAGRSIDRIDVNGNYSPGNCRWADNITQGRNRRNNRIISFKGEKKCLSEWAEELGMEVVTLHSRLSGGWTVEQAFGLPVERGTPLSRRAGSEESRA